MASNQLSGRPFFPRSPAVCIGKPGGGSKTLYLMLWIKPERVMAYQEATVFIDALNPIFPLESRYEAAWNPGTGHILPYPVPLNGRVMSGTWHAPGYEHLTWITVTVTWPDGQALFRAIPVLVVPFE